MLPGGEGGVPHRPAGPAWVAKRHSALCRSEDCEEPEGGVPGAGSVGEPSFARGESGGMMLAEDAAIMAHGR